MGVDSDIISLNPFQRTSSITKHVGTGSFECLLAMDNNFVLRPALAASWDVSKDGREYTFHLRKGVKFHNGKEMTAEDVIWSVQYAQDPKNAAYGKDKVQTIQSMTAPDPWTLRVTLEEPYVAFLDSISTGHDAFPVVPKGSVPSGRGTRLKEYPPGTGPFVMTDYKPNQVISFKRFDQYWQKGIPYLDGIEFRIISDPTVRFTALRTGDVDIMTKLTYEYALRVKAGEIKGVSFGYSEIGGYRALIMNMQNEPFNNLKLRQAVSYAIDKRKIIDGLTFGFGSVYDQKVPKKSRWYVPLKQRKRDLVKARALMKEAGYPDGLKVKSQVSRGWPNSESMQLVQSQLREIGLDIELELVDFAKNQEIKRTGNFQIVPLGGAIYTDPDLAYYQYFHTEEGPSAQSNFLRYSNPKVDSLLEQGRKEPDFQKRYQIYKEAVEIIDEDMGQITIGLVPNPFAHRNDVKGFEEKEINNDFNYVVGGLSHTWLDR
jgi:peptide/nickel transport system substrate-binding protein